MRPVTGTINKNLLVGDRLIEKKPIKAAVNKKSSSKKEHRTVCPACGGHNVALCPWDNCYMKAH
jgi:Zn finger protein HypA/HybF involved in hydrogenase expression